MRSLSRILSVAVLFMAGYIAQAQHEEGQSNINLGVGFVTFYTGDATMPPLSLSYDYGINDNISVGGYAGYFGAEEELGSFGGETFKWKYSYLVIGVRGAYHLELIDDFDTYGGLMLGYNAASASWEGSETFKPAVEPSVGGIALGAFVGGRYHFTDNIGAFLELGYGVSALNIGLTARF